ncbi:hypothetical protein BC832DRAFT_548998 [Gaertneriomyces semiglobifer]|nr:hypothetical protein BC832DRAFT_548998 [Gaertneriomyces semiglobifer]
MAGSKSVLGLVLINELVGGNALRVGVKLIYPPTLAASLPMMNEPDQSAGQALFTNHHNGTKPPDIYRMRP